MIGNFPRRPSICDVHEALQFRTCIFSSQNCSDYTQNPFKVMITVMFATLDNPKHNTKVLLGSDQCYDRLRDQAVIFRNIESYITYGTYSLLRVDWQQPCTDPTAQTAPSVKGETKLTKYQILFWIPPRDIIPVYWQKTPRDLEENLLVTVKSVPITVSLGHRPVINATGVQKKCH
jgi:hypothetical protein